MEESAGRRGRYAEDITGMRSGALVAVERSGATRRGSGLWRCVCDCGNELLVEPNRIRRGAVKSCGCKRGESRIKDLTGRRFGRLTALDRMEEKRGGKYMWRCRCDCGQETEVPVSSLLSGNTTSCGCRKRERLRERARDIGGQRFGMLTALEPLAARKYGGVMWRCRCDCGGETEATLEALTSGNTTSCGCLKSKHAPPPMHYMDGTCLEMIAPGRKLRKDNTSGHTGVQQTSDGRWRATLTFRGKRHILGTFSDKQMAVKARQRGEEQIFGRYMELVAAAETDGRSAI